MVCLRNWPSLVLTISVACLSGRAMAGRAIAADRVAVLREDFEGLRSKLGPNQDEPAPPNPYPQAFTHTPPAGWAVESNVPAGGVTEWQGWSFANPGFWAQAGGDGRADFQTGTGRVIAVADSDSYVRTSGGLGSYNTFLQTPAINLANVAPGALELSFDSSWRGLDQQAATLTATYDGGTPIEILRWESDAGSPNFKGDATAERLSVGLQNPAGASSVVLGFGYTQAANDWWWAVDNLQVRAGSDVLLNQDFESMSLGPPVDEPHFLGDPQRLWTASAPAGWTADRSGVPGAGNGTTDGVTEWAGWSFVDKDWWVFAADDQKRSSWTLGSGVVAVADPDEWDDQPHSPSAANGWYKTGLTTPPINVSQLKAGTVELKFDNSWRPEFGTNFRQSAKIRVAFDGGTPTDLTTWESVNSGGQKTRITDLGSDAKLTTSDLDLINTTEVMKIPNPAGAVTMTVEFYMYDAGDDWWWAIDNLEVTGEIDDALPFSCSDFDRDRDVDSSDLGELLVAWTGQGGTGAILGDCDIDGDVDTGDLLEFLSNWTGAFGAERLSSPVIVPEPTGGLWFSLAALGVWAKHRRRSGRRSGCLLTMRDRKVAR
ncbi:MAG: hypothetical protein U0795_25885 [Pirellulales bacterium]